MTTLYFYDDVVVSFYDRRYNGRLRRRLLGRGLYPALFKVYSWIWAKNPFEL